MRRLGYLACLLLAWPAAGDPIPPTRYRMVFPGATQGTPLDLDDARTWRGWMESFDYDVAGFCAQESHADVILRDALDLRPLLDAGFVVVETEETHPLAAVQGLRGGPPGYASFSDVNTFLQATATAHPSITQVVSIGLTTELRDVYAIEISDNPGQPEDEPAILLNGLHHAREVATPHVIMDAITYLTDEYAAGNPQVVDWVTNYKIFCIPMVNPDGSNEVFTVDSFHRKNMRAVCTTGGSPNPGVDLNRNYPYHWGTGPAVCEHSPSGGSSGTTCAQTYRGPPPYTPEPETQAMMDLAAQQHFVIAASYHSSGRFIDYPYACNDGTPDNRMPEHDVIDEMMHGMADGIEAVDSIPYDVYSPVAMSAVNGDDTSWYYAHHGTYAMIIEMGTSFQPAFSISEAEVARNRGGWQYLFDRLGGARIDVRVADHLTGAPLVAQVELLDYTFDTDELPRLSDALFGRRRWLVPASDQYTVRVSATGYATRTLAVDVAEQPVDLPVLLLAAGAVLGDADADNDVDLVDFTVMQRCAGEPTISPACRRFDFSANESVPAADAPGFATAMSGPQ